MATQKLITRVKGHNTKSNTMGVVTLALFVECVEHFMEHNDWTPLATLIAGQDSARSKTLRRFAGNIIQGWKFIKDDKQDCGYAFRKAKDANYGFDKTKLGKVVALVNDNKSVGSQEALALWKPISDKPDVDVQTKCAVKAQNAVKAIAKALKVSEAQAIAFIQAHGIEKKEQVVDH